MAVGAGSLFAYCHAAILCRGPRLQHGGERQSLSRPILLCHLFLGVSMSALTLLAPLGAVLLSFLGLPVATPPAKEDPLMARVAPADCIAYAAWAARAEPSA